MDDSYVTERQSNNEYLWEPDGIKGFSIYRQANVVLKRSLDNFWERRILDASNYFDYFLFTKLLVFENRISPHGALRE